VNGNIAKHKNREPSASFSKLIQDLLNINFMRRIGSSFTEFIEHPFFKGFYWEEPIYDEGNFAT